MAIAARISRAARQSASERMRIFMVHLQTSVVAGPESPKNAAAFFGVPLKPAPYITAHYCLFWTANSRTGLLLRDAGENGRVMAACCKQHEDVPDGILKPQPLPEVKDDAQTIKSAAHREKPQARAGKCRREVIIGHDPAPSHEQAQHDGQAVETAGKRELDESSEERGGPEPDGETE